MISVVWARRSTKDLWHALTDYWDAATLCGRPAGSGWKFDVNPSGARCEACELKVIEDATKTGVGPS